MTSLEGDGGFDIFALTGSVRYKHSTPILNTACMPRLFDVK